MMHKLQIRTAARSGYRRSSRFSKSNNPLWCYLRWSAFWTGREALLALSREGYATVNENEPSDQEIVRRRDEALRRALNKPPTLHKQIRRVAAGRTAHKRRGLHLRCDAVVALAAIAAVKLELDRDLPRDARECVLDLLERPEEMFRVQMDVGAARARKVTVRLNPSDRLIELLAALRAGNVD
jgi:hypothetical protein